MKDIKDYICKFNKEHIIISSFAITILTLIISSLFSWDSEPITGFDKLSADIIISVVCICLIFILNLWSSAGFHKEGFYFGLLLGVPFVIIGILAAIIGNIGIRISDLEIKPFSYILLFTINMFMVGVNEEISMRALVLNNLLNHYGKTISGMKKSIFISAAIFGLIHLVNIFFMSPITVLVQAVNAAAAGILFAVIFIAGKNIWSGIVIHFIVDWLSLFVGQCFIGGASVLSVEINIFQGLIMICLGSIPPIIIAWIIMKSRVKAAL